MSIHGDNSVLKYFTRPFALETVSHILSLSPFQKYTLLHCTLGRPNFKAHSFLASLTKKLLKFKISGQNSNIFLGSQAIENSKTTGGTPWMFQFPRLGCPGR